MRWFRRPADWFDTAVPSPPIPPPRDPEPLVPLPWYGRITGATDAHVLHELARRLVAVEDRTTALEARPVTTVYGAGIGFAGGYASGGGGGGGAGGGAGSNRGGGGASHVVVHVPPMGAP